MGRWSDRTLVARDIIDQRRYMGYDAITLDLYPERSSDAGERMIWTGTTELHAQGNAPPVSQPCRIATREAE